ncbi:hypothetical protein L6164_016118 [Bauhinia variegata]|uniref:Uncharacterized protein n=1 Tax=Bauhinia variegata TaxID=167791 RepID=A0ACB9NNL3_BAUVA|nr:hypothetical protein L6164_016118 [Bauhinia variegata]
MAMAGHALAEAYVLRKLHEVKKEAEEEERTKTEKTGYEAKPSSGCFLWLSKSEHRRRSAREFDPQNFRGKFGKFPVLTFRESFCLFELRRQQLLLLRG